MSIGTEDEKGTDFTRETFELLKASGLNFRGNVEGHDLFENPVEVVVADGFTGNIVLKTSEAVAHAIFRWVKHEIKQGVVTSLGGMLAKPALKRIHRKTNSDEYGGMPLLGVDGVCIIAHGGSSPLAMRNAIRMACDRSTDGRWRCRHDAARERHTTRASPRIGPCRQGVAVLSGSGTSR